MAGEPTEGDQAAAARALGLDPSLLDILACPNCYAALHVDAPASRLVCTGCGYRYRVDDAIPVMLLDEAEKPDQPLGAGEPAGGS